MAKNILVYVETAEGKPVNVGLEMLTAAKEIGEKVIALVIGAPEAAAEAIQYGADEAVTIAADGYNAEVYAADIAAAAKAVEADVVMIGATTDGKDLGGRVSAILKAGAVTDVIGVAVEDGKVVLTSPLYGGNIQSKSVVEGTAIAVVRGGVFKKAEPDAAKTGAVTEVAPADVALKTKVVEAVKEVGEMVNLEEAEIIVTAGKGMGNPESMALVQELADVVGGVVGATRPVIEEGLISKVHQIGQSGKIVAPKIYFAFGVSGATQHVSGMIGSDYVVAVNKDEDAAIFDVADVGIVGDGNTVIKMFIDAYKAKA